MSSSPTDLPALIGFACEAVLYGETFTASVIFSTTHVELQAATAFFSSSLG
jgi:hypothetical protein